MWIYWRLVMVVFHLVSPGIILSQTTEKSSSEINTDPGTDRKIVDIVLDKCCKNKELFDIVSNRCIKLENKILNNTSNPEQEFSLGKYKNVFHK